MYVAMTRARKEVHLFGKRFLLMILKELKKEFNDIKSMEGDTDITENNVRICPTHKVKLQKEEDIEDNFMDVLNIFLLHVIY